LPDGSYPSLSGCVRDVQHVEGFLRGTLKVPAARIRKLTSTDTGNPEPPEPSKDRPSYENIVQSFAELAKRAESGDQVYIHYSGHGGRSVTAYPSLKGKDGVDESLVPLDIGHSEARYVRDLELAALLKKLTDNGLLVTIILDCCHSGGATRAIRNNVGVRGVSFVDSTRRPPGNVTIPDELLSAWKDQKSTRGMSVQSGFLREPKGYTLLAACRPSELAYEFAFDGNERNGALTYWMLDTFGALTPDMTYKDLYNRILAKVHGQFELQTPMLAGESDRVVFGVSSVPTHSSAVVLKVDDNGKSVRIGGGQATGLRKGAQLAIYPRGETDLASKAKRKAIVEIDVLGATDSTAIVLPPRPKTKIDDGDQAILLGAGSGKLVRPVSLVRADGAPATKSDVALQKVAKTIAGSGWLELAGAETPAAFVVTLNKEGSEYEICDQGGEPIANLNPPISVTVEGGAEAVVKRLMHLAKYRGVQDLDNFDQSSPLKGKLSAELVGFETDYDPADKPKPKPFVSTRRPSVLRIGETAFLKITNNFSDVLNIVVLDLDPSCSITQIFPGGQNVYFEPLDPGRSLDLIPLRADLPPEYSHGTDIIKVFATRGAPNFQVLELPSLEQSDQGRPNRGATRSLSASVDPLDSLLEAVAADQPKFRSLSAQSSPSSDWTLAQIEVAIERAPHKTDSKSPRKVRRKSM